MIKAVGFTRARIGGIKMSLNLLDASCDSEGDRSRMLVDLGLRMFELRSLPHRSFEWWRGERWSSIAATHVPEAWGPSA